MAHHHFSTRPQRTCRACTRHVTSHLIKPRPEAWLWASGPIQSSWGGNNTADSPSSPAQIKHSVKLLLTHVSERAPNFIAHLFPLRLLQLEPVKAPQLVLCEWTPADVLSGGRLHARTNKRRTPRFEPSSDLRLQSRVLAYLKYS